MGSILTNGVFLPAEGERNCYEGLAANWTALDGLIGGYNAHIGNATIHVTAADKEAWNGKADASALTAHTGDTTIHVTSADKQAWDGHVADTTIHVTSADKQAWNGKADASALTAHTGDTTIHVTSADKQTWNSHVADTTIHVTSADKQAWNGKQDALSQTQLDAVNSGIDSTKVQQIATNTSDISSLQSGKANDADVVHKSGNETISGVKTFSDNLTIYNSDDTVTPKGLVIRNAQWGMGESGGTTVSNISFLDKKSSIPVFITASKGIYGQSYLRFGVRTKDSQNTAYTEEIYYDIDTSGNTEFRSWHDNAISLGTSAYRWKDFYTNKVNGLEPSSLSLPATRGTIDISSYITDLTGVNVNYYTPLGNGYIVITCNSNDVDYIKMSNNLDFVSVIDNTNHQFTSGILGVWQPCIAGIGIQIRIKSSALKSAKFIPCQGNV